MFDTLYLLTISINKGTTAFSNIEPYYNFLVYPVTNSIRQFAYTGSIYMIVGLTLERYLSYCHPNKAKHHCTPGKAKMLIACVSIFSVLYTIPVFCEHYWAKNENGTIAVFPTVLREKKSHVERPYYLSYRLCINVIVRFIIPALCLVVSNIRIIIEVHSTYLHI